MPDVSPLDQLQGTLRDVRAALDGLQAGFDVVQATSRDLQSAIAGLQAMLDIGRRLQDGVTGWFVKPAEEWVQLILATTSAQASQDFTTDATIQAWQPTVEALAMVALTAVVVWAFYRVMFAHGSFTQYTARIMLPRFVVAFGLIYFSNQLVQAAVDFNNVLTSAIVRHAGDSVDLLRMVERWGIEAATAQPGPGPVIAVGLVLGFLLLGFVYCVRYALLVVLTILAPVAALLLVLPETKRYAHEWGSLFLTTLLMQPLQVFILAVGLSLEARGTTPLRHGFAVAALWMCFKVPGALRSASAVGSHAESIVHRQATQLMKAATKLAKAAI